MRVLFILCFFCFAHISIAQSPKRELRAVWIPTVTNIEWPSSKTLTVGQQQQELITILDQHKLSGINAVYLQVRGQADAIYPTTVAPFADIFTGSQGVLTNPIYDPLQFAIDKCRERNMEIHAWCNPYRAISNANNLSSFAANHIAKTRPDLLLTQGTLRVLDPGKFEVIDTVIKCVMDIVSKYDIDGIHFDDYFYPYPPAATITPFNDDATFTDFPRGFTNKGDWRRANVDSLIKRTYDTIKKIKPWVKFGVSPFGIWRNNTADPNGSATSGLQSYSDTYANAKKWIENKWVDYLAPQIYWSIGFAPANYSVLVNWWSNNSYERHIYAGMAAYKINNNTDANWSNPAETANQIKLNRTTSNILGNAFYNSKAINANPLGVKDTIRKQTYFGKPALLPIMPWVDNIAPNSPSSVMANVMGNKVNITWLPALLDNNALQKVTQYVIYRSSVSPINTNTSEALLAIVNSDRNNYIDSTITIGASYYYTVTALDRLHNESLTSNTINVNTTVTAIPINTALPTTFKIFVSNAATITAQIKNVKSELLTIAFYAVEGKLVYSSNLGTVLSGTQYINFPNLKLASGAYIARLFGSKTFTDVKFVIPK